MKKSVQIFVVIDDVDLQDLAQIIEEFEKVIASYDDKRLQVTIQDEPMVRH